MVVMLQSAVLDVAGTAYSRLSRHQRRCTGEDLSGRLSRYSMVYVLVDRLFHDC